MFEIELFLCIKMDSALNSLKWLICHKTKLNQTENFPSYLLNSSTAVFLQG